MLAAHSRRRGSKRRVVKSWKFGSGESVADIFGFGDEWLGSDGVKIVLGVSPVNLSAL